ncbi:MAG: sensor histidine kinase [Armatimonadota bacterium]
MPTDPDDRLLNVTALSSSLPSALDWIAVFGGIADYTEDLHWISKLDPTDGWRLLYLNPSLASLFGVPDGEIPAQIDTCLESVHSDDHPAILESLARCQRGEGGMDVIYRLITPETDLRWLYTRACALSDENGISRWTIGYTQDITQQKISQYASRRSNEIRDAVVDNLPLGVFVKDAATRRIVMCNAACEELFGRSHDDIIGITARDVLPKTQADAIYHSDTEALVVKKFVEIPAFEVNHPMKGKRIWHTRRYPICDAQGEAEYLLCIADDITEQKLTEEALQTSEARFRQLFETINSGVVIFHVEDEGHVLICKEMNAAAERIGGIPREEALGKRLDVLFPGIEQMGFLESAHVAWITGETQHLASTLYQDDRITIWVDNYLFRLPTGEMVAVFDDVTPRKEADEALHRSREQLRNIARRLASAEEQERQRIARELHDQVGQNLTALGIILGSVRDAMPDGISDRIRGHLREAIRLVEETTERNRTLMLDLRPPVLDDYGFFPALKWYGTLFEKRTGIPVEVESIGELTRLPADVETALFRIAQEALMNTAKHAQASTVFLTFETAATYVRLIIMDDGQGFDPLESHAHKNKTPSGWGMMLMQERAQAVGGTINIDSQPQEGTRVTIDIPRLLDESHHSHC